MCASPHDPGAPPRRCSGGTRCNACDSEPAGGAGPSAGCPVGAEPPEQPAARIEQAAVRTIARACTTGTSEPTEL
jgi:hypothetical protein